MPTLQTDRIEGQDSRNGRRLDSWKEIAAYLGRGERTVKRWETDRGLPIRRVPGRGRGSVYAYTEELAHWLEFSLNSERESPEGTEPTPEVPELESPSLDSSAIQALQPDVSEVSMAKLLQVHELLEPSLSDDLLSGSARSSEALNQKQTIGRWHLPLVWLVAIAALLLLVSAATALRLTSLRTPARPLGSTLSSFFSRSQSKPSQQQLADGGEKAQARQFYLKGRYEWSQRTPDSLNRALDSFTQAIVHDPADAQAYAGLADTYDLLQMYTNMPENDAFIRAMAAAKTALELDDSLAEAHRALAYAEFYGTGILQTRRESFSMHLP